MVHDQKYGITALLLV